MHTDDRNTQILNTRQLARHFVLSTCSQLALPFLVSSVNRNRVHFLVFHHVFEHEEQNFINLIEWLLNSGQTIISYSDAINKVYNGNIDKPYIAFSFDDGLKNCIRASELLCRYEISACFFVNSKIIGEENIEIIRIHCLQQLAISPMPFLSWSDIEIMVNQGHEIGGHTYSHVNLANIENEHIFHELSRDKNILESRLGTIKHFAWPYGMPRHFTAFAHKNVVDVGYQSCASAVRGAHFTELTNSNTCIFRENLVASWPLKHIKYFLALSAAKQSSTPLTWNELRSLEQAI